jgi:MFS family permease
MQRFILTGAAATPAPSWRQIIAQPTIIAIILEGFLTRLGFGMIGFALPLYALSLGVNIAEVGLLYALRTVVTLLMKPAMGWVADRFGRKRVMVGAVMLRCLVGFLFMFAVAPWQLFAIRGLQGAMTAAREPSAMALLAEHGDKRKMATVFAWYTTARDLGKSLGFGLAGLLIAFFSYQFLFLVAFICSCAALFTVVRYVSENKVETKKKIEGNELSRVQEPPGRVPFWRLVRFGGFGLMVALSAEMMRGLYPIIATQYGHLTVAQAGVAASAASVVILVAGPAFGWLADRGNRKLVLSIRSLANALSSLCYILIPSFPGFLAGRVLDDTGKAAFRPAWGSMLAEISEGDKKSRAKTMAAIDTAADAGEILGPIVAGLIISSWGIPVMLVTRIVLSLLTEVQAFALFRRRKKF